MKKIPDFRPGDLIKIYSKIKEGDKERITQFQGIVVQQKGSGIGTTFTVRKISAGVGVERIFPLHSPIITKIEIKKKGKVRRARLTYLRKQIGRKMRVRETAEELEESTAQAAETPVEQEIETPKEKAGEGIPRQKTVGTP